MERNFYSMMACLLPIMAVVMSSNLTYWSILRYLSLPLSSFHFCRNSTKLPWQEATQATLSLTFKIYFAVIEGGSASGSSYQLRISAYQLSDGTCQKTEPIPSREPCSALSVNHVTFLESRTLSGLILDDLLHFSVKSGKGERVLYASGQVRSVDSGFFMLPLKTEKGLHLDMKLRVVGETVFQ